MRLGEGEFTRQSRYRHNEETLIRLNGRNYWSARALLREPLV